MTEPQIPANIWHPQPFFSHVITSLRQFDAINDAGGIAVGFQPPKSDRPHLSISGCQGSRLSLWRTVSQTGFETVPKFSNNLLTVRFVTRGQMLHHGQHKQLVGCPGYAMMAAFDGMRRAEASRDFEALSATITQSALAASNRLLEGRDHESVPEFEPIAATDNRQMRSLLQTIGSIYSRLQQGSLEEDISFPILEEILSYQILSGWPRIRPQNTRNPIPTSQLRIKQAINFIDSNISRSLTLSEVAAAAGVSVRSLQISFKKELQKSPVEYIILRRLQLAHDDFKCPSQYSVPIREIAKRWGFVHMSDFSMRYRKLFGCTPGATRGYVTGH